MVLLTPGIGAGLRQTDVLQHAVDVVARNVVDGLRVVVERGDHGEDSGSGFGDRSHVAQVDEVQRSLADAENKAAAFFQADIRSALDKIVGEAVGDAAQRAHGAGKDDHGVHRVGAATRWVRQCPRAPGQCTWRKRGPAVWV